ncbi:hypothetical protein TDMWS_05130 [Thermodesulfomicrobium sp. WS]|uniref:CRISPR-associated endonuclease Cas2 n=1 Tax=Thermodesulfomicrobium sp. WS TaxID=3004129 RepID=UPI002490F76E|nr:CRISPR-associated endonuclease Cas2 [Thermodesulfomicrobium sp. WS]BDV00428.1 hypothetical protein TDMWS_05130 [Thermodesulfomicrobium sp. WS]
MFYVICYDIAEDRARTKAAKLLDGYGRRVQKSVYECEHMSERQLLRLLDKLERLLDHTSDSVRCYRLCRSCLTDFEGLGIGEPPRLRSSAYL